MPGLSSSTMNLKFMQRATARAPASASASTPSTPGPSTPKPHLNPNQEVSASASASADLEVSTPTPEAGLIASEEPYRWTLNRPSSATNGNGMLIPKSSGVKFESSYLPFMEGEASSSTSTSTPASGGGGRMVFGYKEPEQEDLEKEEEGSDLEGEDVVVNVREREKERGKGKREYTKQRPRPMAASSSKGFIRPRSRSVSPERKPNIRQDEQAPRASLIPMKTSQSKPNHAQQQGTSSTPGYSAHSHGKHTTSTPGKSISTVKTEPSTQANRADSQTKGKKRKQSQSGGNVDSPKTSTTSDKKPRLGPSMLNDYPSQTSEATPPPASTSTPASANVTSIDDREQALKAQRKKEKNARKKARKSNEKST
jgi:hypothetical protein